MLHLRDVGAGYGPVQILFDVSLHVAQGEALAVVGPNGTGKTTLLRTISAFRPTTSGSIELDGDPIHNLRPDEVVRRGISHVLEGRRIFAPMTVRDNLLLGAHQRLAARTKRSAAAETLDRCYELFPILKARAALPAGSLSGGEQQMLAISRALMAAPRILLLDEPSMGLAPFIVDQVVDALLALKADGLTMILVEQNPDVPVRIADRCCILETGRVTEEGDVHMLEDRERVALLYLGGEEG